MQKNQRMTLSIIALNYCLFGFDPFYWNCFNVIFCMVVLHMVSFLKTAKSTLSWLPDWLSQACNLL